MRGSIYATFAIALAFSVWSAAPAQALTMKACSAKYQAAKAGGALQGRTWKAFRKAECGGETVAKTPVAEAPKEADVAGAAVFPTTVSTAYSAETPARARLRTCSDQYRANKASGGNAGLKWLQKGGGYYSQCNARLKS